MSLRLDGKHLVLRGSILTNLALGDRPASCSEATHAARRPGVRVARYEESRAEPLVEGFQGPPRNQPRGIQKVLIVARWTRLPHHN